MVRAVLLVLSVSVGAMGATCGPGVFEEIQNPIFYMIERDGERSLLLGTALISLPIKVFPGFVREAIEKAPLLAYDNPNHHHIVVQSIFMENAELAVGTSRPSISSQLPSDLARFYKELMEYNFGVLLVRQGINPSSLPEHVAEGLFERQFNEVFDRYSPLIASFLVSDALHLAVCSVGQPDTPSTDQQTQEFKESLEQSDESTPLLHQILSLAPTDRRVELETPTTLTRLFAERDTIDALIETLRVAQEHLKAVQQGQMEIFHYLTGDLDPLLDGQHMVQRVAPRLYQQATVDRIRNWMGKIKELHNSGESPLLLIPYGRLPGKDGLLNQLEMNGFTIHRVVTPDRWEKLKPASY